MYTEAFLFIGNLLQNHLIIQKIELLKKGFCVKWTDGGKTKHSYDESEIIEFIELYEDQEKQLKK